MSKTDDQTPPNTLVMDRMDFASLPGPFGYVSRAATSCRPGQRSGQPKSFDRRNFESTQWARDDSKQEVEDFLSVPLEMYVPSSIEPPAKTFQPRFALLNKFEGFVVSVDQESFVARFNEKKNDAPPFEAEFDLDDVSAVDRELVKSGAFLVWTITYRYEEPVRYREASLYFRRSLWNESDLAIARMLAAWLLRKIEWQSDPASD